MNNFWLSRSVEWRTGGNWTSSCMSLSLVLGIGHPLDSLFCTTFHGPICPKQKSEKGTRKKRTCTENATKKLDNVIYLSTSRNLLLISCSFSHPNCVPPRRPQVATSVIGSLLACEARVSLAARIRKFSGYLQVHLNNIRLHQCMCAQFLRCSVLNMSRVMVNAYEESDSPTQPKRYVNQRACEGSSDDLSKTNQCCQSD
jgi:hypothetical protein